MKIGTLRLFYNEYTHTTYIRRVFYGNHDEAKKLYAFLVTLSYLPPENVLNSHQLLNLLSIISVESKLNLIYKLQAELTRNCLLPFYQLTSAVIDAEMIEQFSYLDIFQKRFLLSLLPTQQTLTRHRVEALTELAFNPYMLQIMKLSDDNTQPILIKICLQNPDKLNHIYYCLKQLERFQLLHPFYIDAVGNNQETLVSVLAHALKFLNQDNLKTILRSQKLAFLSEAIKIISNANKLDAKSFQFILDNQHSLNKDNLANLQLLSTHKTLELEVIKLLLIVTTNSLANVLPFLIKNYAEIGNTTLIKHLLENKFEPIIIIKTYGILQEHGLQTVISLNDLCLQLTNTKYLLVFFTSLKGYNVKLDAGDLTTVMQFTERNLQRLDNLLFLRSQCAVVNRAFLKVSIERIKPILPTPARSEVIKQSRKHLHTKRSILKLPNLSPIYIQHKDNKEYYSGGIGKVKKGYLDDATHTPSYCIKIFSGDKKNLIDDAKREVKYRQFLGGDAFYFQRNHKLYFMSNWVKGRSLNLYKADDLTVIPFKDRIQAIICLLKELNQLHSHYRIHGDVKYNNCIFNHKNKTLKLIDFGGAQKVGHKHALSCTPYFMDNPKPKAKSFADDMFGAGIVITFMFPEYFKVTLGKKLEINPILDQSEGIAVYTLITEMMLQDRSSRCTSAEALTYCEGLMADKVTEKTFCDQSYELENFFRGKMT